MTLHVTRDYLRHIYPKQTYEIVHSSTDYVQGHEEGDSQESLSSGKVKEGNDEVNSHQRETTDTLPKVECIVRARIPTSSHPQTFLHLYHNSIDTKEHLAITFGNQFKSQSLQQVRPDECELDRITRGASSEVSEVPTGGSESESGPGSLSESSSLSVSLSILDSTTGVTKNSCSVSTTSIPNGYEREVIDQAKELYAPLVRIHSECFTGETIGSVRCDCGEQLDEAVRLITQSLKRDNTGGVIVYLRQEGRGIGLAEKLKAYNLQDLGHDTYDANILLQHPPDARSYDVAAAILLDLGLSEYKGIRLMTNNPEKVNILEKFMGKVGGTVERIPMIPVTWQTNGKRGIKGPDFERYVSTKIKKFSHHFTS